MKRLSTTTMLCFALTAQPAAAASGPDPGTAAAHYAAGRYAEAVQAYQAVAEREGVSAPLYYDLGASQLAAGDVGPAILNLSRARWLAPGDAGIRAALGQARERAGLPAEARGTLGRMRDLVRPDAWAVLAAVALVVACAAASASLLASNARPATGWVRRTREGVLATAVLSFLVAASVCASLALERDQAVAIASDVVLRVAPFDAAEGRGTLSLGESVRTLERHGEFVRVRAADARTGWVPARDVGAVVPG